MVRISEELISYEAGLVVEYLYENPGVSEFDISDETNLKIAKVRSLLYELESINLIESEKKKDKEKGWYLYYWKVLENNFSIVYRNQKKEKLENFEERLEIEENSVYYICPNFCKRLSFEESLENNFSCSTCGTLMEEESKERKLRMLKRNIAEHKRILTQI